MSELTSEIKAELNTRFNYHSPTEEQIPKYEALRNATKELAIMVVTMVPESRERSLALTHLEQVSFYANAGIARRKGYEFG